MELYQLLTSLAATAVLYGLYRLSKLIYEEYTSPLRDLPGPKQSSLIYGNLKEVWAAELYTLQDKWVAEFGTTLHYKSLLGMSRLYTIDTKALNHVLMNNYVYQKPEATRYNLSRITGSGVLVVEGDKHKQQRKIMNPAFGAAQTRELTELFIEKSIQLRDLWTIESMNQGGTARIDVLSWTARMALDVIGLAGFNYDFEALSDHGKPNELGDAFSVMFKSGSNVMPMLRAMFPIFRMIPSKRATQQRDSRNTMKRIGNQLLQDSKASILNGDGEDAFTKQTLRQRRDVLSLLVHANMATDLADHQRMSDQDVIDQIPTIMVAGHETTSTGTTWALFALTQNLEVQNKLRDELLTVSTEKPTMEELNALPYLDKFVREALRLHAPVPATIRVAAKDDILPLNNPITDKKGNVQHGIRIRKGQAIVVPILALNRAKSVWGEDALEFRPERWDSLPEAASSIPGVWSNMLTFLGGPRACIGYRFSLVEMKALLFTLIRAFEFELAVPVMDIGKKSAIVQRPILLTDPASGSQLPLRIKPYSRP